jgi:hypothetical protein
MTSIAPLPKMTIAEYLDWEPRQDRVSASQKVSQDTDC